ncbi:MAG: alpha-amylase family glycosyl hydrolase, partial [Miltoncostaeaceae bacterium]
APERERGPPFRGLDNAAYYRLVDDDPRHYYDTTGTGNTLLMRHPAVLQMVMDSLRYWVEEMHVDGFRFDLAASLARQFHEVDRLSAFFDLVHQDPVVNRVKLIAEPWDLGPGGYQVGNFPPLWTEWNGQYRDVMRDFWRGDPATLGDFAARLAGSSDLYQTDGRHPSASINFITAHDGFTLRDLVSYDHKHNEANGEDGADGESHNRSWNHGAEGETDDAGIVSLRDRQRRNMLVTLLLSQGVPMLLHGDELGRTQRGNNNGYCQDNELSWIDWAAADDDLVAFTGALCALRAAHPVFRRRRFVRGDDRSADGRPGIGWYRPDGTPMSTDDWGTDATCALAVFLNGEAIHEPGPRGERIEDDSFLIAFNAHHEPARFRLGGDAGWEVVVDTAAGMARAPRAEGADDTIPAGASLDVEGRAVVVLFERS